MSLAVSGVGGAAPRAGSPVRLAAALGSTAGCRLTAAPGQVRLTVTSGADRVWDSAGCPVATTGAGVGTTGTGAAAAGRALLLPAQATVPAGGTAVVNVVWPGVRLGAGCAPAPTALRAGTYTATLRLPGAAAVTTAFQLR